MANNLVWAGRRAYNTVSTEKDIDTTPYAGELLTVTKYTVNPVMRYHSLLVRHEDGTEFIVTAYEEQRKILEEAGHVIPIFTGTHEFSAVITCKHIHAYGRHYLQIATCEPVSKPVEAAPELRSKWHGETITIHNAREIGKGAKSRWRLEGRDSAGDMIRFEAWFEHNICIQQAGHPALPKRGTGVQPTKFDCVLEYDTSKHEHRITHVYKADGNRVSIDEALAAYDAKRNAMSLPLPVAKPEIVTIPVVVELSLEEELQAFYINPASGDVMEIIRKHIDIADKGDRVA